jgi:predicted transcriptional regulator
MVSVMRIMGYVPVAEADSKDQMPERVTGGNNDSILCRPGSCYDTRMTKMLDEAIKRIRELPEPDQDEVAEILFSVVSKKAEPIELDDDTLAAIQEGREQARRGEFVSEQELDAFFERHGVKRHRT